MPALTAASWTVAFKKQAVYGGDRCNVVTLALPGTDTYPAGGIPLPPLNKLGYTRNIDSMELFGVNAAAGAVADYMVRYDKVNHKLMLFEEEAAAAGGPLLACDAAEVPGPRTWDVVLHGW